MKFRSLPAILGSLFVPALIFAQSLHTPKAGSEERRAICDGARLFVMNKYATRPLPQPIVFKVDHLAVAGSYANLEAIPLLKDGRYAAPEYMDDIAFNLCLQRSGSGWSVIEDLSRTDVPSPAETEALRRRFPADFPRTLLSSTWRNLLGR